MIRSHPNWNTAPKITLTHYLQISEKKGDFAEKVMSEPTHATRLRLLNRGQGWVVKRLDALLGDTLPASVRDFLEEMKARHIANIAACERLAESLD